MRKAATKIRGVFEKVPGSQIWWICYFDADGRKRREKVGRKGAAIDLYRKRKTGALEGRKLPEKLRARKVSFAELAKDTLDYSKTHKRSYADDKVRMAKVEAWLGQRPADSITPQEIERWLSDKTKLKPATLNRYRALLSLTYRLGMQNGKVQANPARLVRQRREDNGRVRYLTDEEEVKLRGVIRSLFPQHEAELDVALNTGLRLGEQYRLTWGCLNFDQGLLTIPCTKNGETRHIPLNDAARSALEALGSHRSGSSPVFLHGDGSPLASPRCWFDPAVEEAGLADFTWHCLRHTFASRLVMAGVDLRTVQELMGHKTIQMTVRYAHLAPKHQLAAVQRLCDTEAVQGAPSDTRTDTGAKAGTRPGPAAAPQTVDQSAA